jgi:hypothetical protein
MARQIRSGEHRSQEIRSANLPPPRRCFVDRRSKIIARKLDQKANGSPEHVCEEEMRSTDSPEKGSPERVSPDREYDSDKVVIDTPDRSESRNTGVIDTPQRSESRNKGVIDTPQRNENQNKGPSGPEHVTCTQSVVYSVLYDAKILAKRMQLESRMPFQPELVGSAKKRKNASKAHVDQTKQERLKRQQKNTVEQQPPPEPEVVRRPKIPKRTRKLIELLIHPNEEAENAPEEQEME